MSMVTAGIDLAKSMFAVYDAYDNNKAVQLKSKVSRDRL